MNDTGTLSGNSAISVPELEMLARDCEELAIQAQNDGDKGMSRALLSITFRIRHALKPAFPIKETAE